MCKHNCTFWDFLIERGFKNTSIFSKHTVKSSRIFCHSILLCFKSKYFWFFFLVSLLKCILQQHPCHVPTWLSDTSPLMTPKLSVVALIIFTVPSLCLSTGGKFLNLIIIHTLKKARNYYLCQSNRNKWKEGLFACQRHVRPAILPMPQPQSWQAWLQINSNSIQEVLKCIWNLILSCKILKDSHITC